MPRFFLGTFDERWNTYCGELKTCRQEFSAEAVHDLRVATRRLLAVIEMARVIEPHPRLQKARRTLKNQLDELDDLRDTQVMLAELSERLADHPALRAVQSRLQTAERRLLRAARKEVDAFDLYGLKKRIQKIQASLEGYSASVIKQHVFRAVDDSYLLAIQRYGQIDAADSSTIHRSRLAFKKFRYMVEIVQAAVRGLPEQNLERMHQYQASMGEIQDTEWFLNNLAEPGGKSAPDEVQPVYDFYRSMHADLIKGFMEDKGEILTFWRATPDQPFPWQQVEPALQVEALADGGTAN